MAAQLLSLGTQNTQGISDRDYKSKNLPQGGVRRGDAQDRRTARFLIYVVLPRESLRLMVHEYMLVHPPELAHFWLRMTG